MECDDPMDAGWFITSTLPIRSALGLVPPRLSRPEALGVIQHGEIWVVDLERSGDRSLKPKMAGSPNHIKSIVADEQSQKIWMPKASCGLWLNRTVTLLISMDV